MNRSTATITMNKSSRAFVERSTIFQFSLCALCSALTKVEVEKLHLFLNSNLNSSLIQLIAFE